MFLSVGKSDWVISHFFQMYIFGCVCVDMKVNQRKVYVLWLG